MFGPSRLKCCNVRYYWGTEGESSIEDSKILKCLLRESLASGFLIETSAVHKDYARALCCVRSLIYVD